MGEDFKNTWGQTALKSGRVKMASELIDSSIMPGIQGGPLMHVIGGKAVAFGEALEPEFKSYCENIIDNAQVLAESFLEKGYDLVSGGTDTHVLLIDLTSKGISGKKAESLLERAGITTNKNMVPFDRRSPMVTSGIRIGTPALTTRGMGHAEMRMITEWINAILSNPTEEKIIKKVSVEVRNLCSNFPLYEMLNEVQ